MRSLRWLALLAVAAALPGCGKDSTSPGPEIQVLDCPKGAAYAIGQTVTGSLSSSDCRDPGGFLRADYYQFTLTSPGPVTVRLDVAPGTAGPVINAILTADGETDFFRYTSVAGHSTVGGQLPAGTYVIVVAATLENQDAGYTLTSSRAVPPVFDCTLITPHTIGTTVTGSLTPADCTDTFGFNPADYFSFTLANAGPVSFRLQPASQAFVGITDATGSLLAIEGAGPTTPGTVAQTLPAGNYYAIVSGPVAGAANNYTLTSTAALPPPYRGCAMSQPYTLGTTITGTLSTGDCVVNAGSYMDRYDFTTTTKTAITIDLSSTDFGVTLYLFDHTGNTFVRLDQTPNTSSITFGADIPAGAYSIGVSSYLPGVTGSYSLTAH